MIMFALLFPLAVRFTENQYTELNAEAEDALSFRVTEPRTSHAVKALDKETKKD